jgi:hypothetical protein
MTDYRNIKFAFGKEYKMHFLLIYIFFFLWSLNCIILCDSYITHKSEVNDETIILKNCYKNEIFRGLSHCYILFIKHVFKKTFNMDL